MSAPDVSATGVAYYRSTVTAVGPEVEMMLEDGVLILFGDPAPAELAEVSVLHAPDGPPARAVAPGDVVQVGDGTATVTSVGSLADENLSNLGHVVVYLDPDPDTGLLPGALHATGTVGVPAPDAQVVLRAGEAADQPNAGQTNADQTNAGPTNAGQTQDDHTKPGGGPTT